MKDELVLSDYDGTYQYLDADQKMEVEAIATGNNYTEYGRFYDDGVRIPVFWNPEKDELMNVINHKANIINKTGATKFFEDQALQITFLKVLCPKCTFVQIKSDGRTA